MKRGIPRILLSFAVIISMTSLVTGCFGTGSKGIEKPAVLGVINMEKALLGHPKNQELEKLNTQYQLIEEKLTLAVDQAKQAMQKSTKDTGQTSPEEQEFNAKMSARQQALQDQFNKKLNQEVARANETIQAYGDQLEKELQPELFSLQLKMKTVQNSPTEVAQLNDRAEAIKKEFQEKMTARQAQINAQIDQTLLPEKNAIEKELTDYANQLHRELQARTAAQQAETARMQNQPLTGPSADLQKELGMKRQEISTLQEFIVNDVRSKAAKVAAEKNLEVLLIGYRTNITAVDMTDAVIAEMKNDDPRGGFPL